MRKLIYTLTLTLFTIYLYGQSPNLIFEYDFNNNLVDRYSRSTLTPFGTTNSGTNHCNARSGFGNDDNGNYWYWASPSCARGGGFWIDLDSNFNVNNYTVGLRFQFNLTTGYKKIIDFKNLTSDNGFYFYNKELDFYPYNTYGLSQTEGNQLIDIIFTRSSANDTIKIYTIVNGIIYTELKVKDSSQHGIPMLVNGKPRLRFFHDDTQTSTEATDSGKVYSIKIWDAPMSSVEIQTAMNILWEGNTNTDWNTASNWSTNAIPTASNDIEILNVTNKPIIGNGTNAQGKNITINSSSSITIASGGTLTVTQNLTNNGTLTTKSTLAGDGSLITNTISGSGIYKVDRYLAASKWHLVSSPITNGLSGVFQNIWLRAYNESTNTFGTYITPTTTAMPTGQGFSVWTNSANEIRTFSGTINNGSVTPTVQLTGAAGPSTGWNLVGNPYPSAIDWNAASGWTKTNIANSVYVWNNNQYATYIGGIGTNGGSRYIAMEQGFFVQATGAGANISMNNNVRVHNSVSYMKTNENEPVDIIRIKVTAGLNSDEAVIAIRENGSEVFNPETDAVKLPGNSSSPQMYTTKPDNSKLAINTLNTTADVVGKYVYIDIAETGLHKLLFTHTLTQTNIPRLFDTKTQLFVEPNELYSFKAEIGDTNTRFQFIEPIPMSINNGQNSANLTVWESNKKLFVTTSSNETIKQISIFTVAGKLVCQGIQSGHDISNLSSGIYIIEVTSEKSVQTKKITLK